MSYSRYRPNLTCKKCSIGYSIVYYCHSTIKVLHILQHRLWIILYIDIAKQFYINETYFFIIIIYNYVNIYIINIYIPYIIAAYLRYINPLLFLEYFQLPYFQTTNNRMFGNCIQLFRIFTQPLQCHIREREIFKQ